MHGDLSTHLHTEECNQLIQALQKCHIENPFGRFLGKCNEQNALMDRCLAQERQENRRKNREKAQEKKKKLQEALQVQRKKAEENAR
ncbi:PREDICTED: COX assembly mitochondrial protein 2 homolog [Branchiostoma belcheri]|uniref:COX assembly mitochondrial protein n=1 Tax=Branchiostoma belcheri TaxID=7741 RepID=A0A6P4ZED1_BRABE|nr:PREDICTED: COX assembly mitochondrial protein 2 homolog [Branchiostoma belcheri]